MWVGRQSHVSSICESVPGISTMSRGPSPNTRYARASLELARCLVNHHQTLDRRDEIAALGVSDGSLHFRALREARVRTVPFTRYHAPRLTQEKMPMTNGLRCSTVLWKAFRSRLNRIEFDAGSWSDWALIEYAALTWSPRQEFYGLPKPLIHRC